MSTQKIGKKLYLLCALALTLTAGAGCGGKKDDAAVQAEPEKIAVPVAAAAAAKRDIVRTLNFSGSIDAFHRAAIAPAVMGSRVQRIFVEEGQAVREGQVLVRMEDFQLRQSAAQLEQLEADYNRMQALYSRGSVTAQQYEQVKTAHTAAKSGHDLLRNSVELRAPFAGTVIGKYMNEGEVYTGAPGADGIAGVLAIAQLGRMKIEVMVPEHDFVHLRPGMAANVKTDAYPDTVFESKVFTVNPALNRMSRTSRVAIEVRNDRHKLKPGMFARVEIIVGNTKNVLAVPTSSIVTRSGETFVFTVESSPAPFETTPKLVKVKTGQSTEELTEILEGIEEGAVVLIDNSITLSENTTVRITEVK
ncbi:MAG: efflux RND transporter periplasmic adaptor subunit [Chitinispirillales bacterium]|jgi:RND family efflux transporter MFP subunit|nr:efflux RND transporter periplasmic adaptor subunit [Chitinispirillales bacterium]